MHVSPQNDHKKEDAVAQQFLPRIACATLAHNTPAKTSHSLQALGPRVIPDRSLSNHCASLNDGWRATEQDSWAETTGKESVWIKS